jgi:muramoyltetrapeptide carboxypeptidase
VKRERLLAAVAALESEGYAVETAPSAYGAFGILSAPDEVRSRELETMFTRPEIDAVLCARGGVGSSRLLETVDTDSIVRSGKPFLGFSDVTALQWWLFKRYGYVSFSGPLAVEWDGSVNEPSRQAAIAALSGNSPSDLLTGFSKDSMRVLRGSGHATGRLMPGNLTMITTLLGTPYLPDLHDSILFIEDVGEPPYRIDRMLFHLRNAGVLKDLSAIVCGELGEDAGDEAREIIHRSLLDATRGTDYPIVTGAPFGHGAERATLPVGVRVEMNSDTMSLSLLEPMVRA